MEDVSELSDWPSQPNDLSGSNPWLPAYGFQQPAHAFLDKDDFLGNPDADLFLHGGTPQYVYLETIQEETSDDLRSESDLSESRTSPVGWLATDSESGSVIRIQTIEDVDCESDREAACPPKRRRHDPLLLPPCSDDDSSQSLSRSSSLLQFENLEKQCQDNVSSSSPSLFSTFSYDSLERDRRAAVSPDSLDQMQNSDDDEYSRKRLDWRCQRYSILKSFDASFEHDEQHGFGWEQQQDDDGKPSVVRRSNLDEPIESFDSDTETEMDCRNPYSESNGTTKSCGCRNYSTSPDEDGEGHCLVVKIGGDGRNDSSDFNKTEKPDDGLYCNINDNDTKTPIFTNNNKESKMYLHVSKIYQNGVSTTHPDEGSCFCLIDNDAQELKHTDFQERSQLCRNDEQNSMEIKYIGSRNSIISGNVEADRQIHNGNDFTDPDTPEAISFHSNRNGGENKNGLLLENQKFHYSTAYSHNNNNMKREGRNCLPAQSSGFFYDNMPIQSELNSHNPAGYPHSSMNYVFQCKDDSVEKNQSHNKIVHDDQFSAEVLGSNHSTGFSTINNCSTGFSHKTTIVQDDSACKNHLNAIKNNLTKDNYVSRLEDDNDDPSLGIANAQDSIYQSAVESFNHSREKSRLDNSIEKSQPQKTQICICTCWTKNKQSGKKYEFRTEEEDFDARSRFSYFGKDAPNCEDESTNKRESLYNRISQNQSGDTDSTENNQPITFSPTSRIIQSDSFTSTGYSPTASFCMGECRTNYNQSKDGEMENSYPTEFSYHYEDHNSKAQNGSFDESVEKNVSQNDSSPSTRYSQAAQISGGKVNDEQFGGEFSHHSINSFLSGDENSTGFLFRGGNCENESVEKDQSAGFSYFGENEKIDHQSEGSFLDDFMLKTQLGGFSTNSNANREGENSIPKTGLFNSNSINCPGGFSQEFPCVEKRYFHDGSGSKVRGRCSSRIRKVRVGEQEGRSLRSASGEKDEVESEYYKSLKIDVPVKKAGKFHRDEGEDGLRTWRSYEGVQQGRRVRASVENLSEDSGYGEIARTSSIPNMVVVQQERIYPEQDRSLYKTKVQIGTWGFKAYDGEASYGFRGNFGVSYHDLSAVECGGGGVLVERFLRNARGRAGRRGAVNIDASPSSSSAPAADDANFSGATSASEPDLLSACADQRRDDYLISSVPKDLDLCTWGTAPERSVAAKDIDLNDMPKLSRYHRAEYGDKITIRLKYDTSSYSSSSDADAAPPAKPARLSNADTSGGSYKREGSYLEAMANSIDMSDDERKKATKRMSLNERQMLKAISEQSVKSAEHQEGAAVFTSTPISSRNVISTPNLAQLGKDGEYERKSSLVNRDAISASTLTPAKSYGGSSSSKGVTFSPVVAEVNWRDDSTSSDRDSSYSLSSTTPERETPPRLAKPPVFNADRSGVSTPTPTRISASHPELEIMKKRSEDLVKNERQFPEVDKREVEMIRNHNSERALKMDEEAEERVAALRASKSQPTLKTECGEEKWGKRPVGGGGESGGAVGAATKSSGRTVAAMEEPRRAPKQNKIGGFFSRLASFRFSARKNNEKNKKSKVGEEAAVTAQRLATKDDYIYIPLKEPQQPPPTVAAAVKTGEVRGKPPLPKLPPRVVGACAKGGGARGAEKSASGVIDCGLAPRRPMEPMGLIETDLDTEVTVITSNGVHVKTRSLMNLGAGEVEAALHADAGEACHHHRPGRPHKSMEFLLDKQNLKVVEPPENELQKGGERVMSEHQLRVQRSLQKLNVPDWYKHNQVPREGFLLRKSSGAAAAARESRWQGTASSKTTSLSSLGGSNAQSPVILSPTMYSQPFVRWSTSKLNSTASSPCASTRSSFNARQPNGSISPSSLRGSFNYRQPYLGWRSQERLSRPRTPAERLANSLLSQTPAVQQPQESPEIQTSIKEVTSAIVHYVSGLRPDEGQEQEHSRSASPRGSQRLCWLESSFVGTRPLDSPQTPISLTESPAPIPVPPTTLRLDLQTHNDVVALSSGGGGGSRKPSPSSTTLEDVLDSLLGLPSSTRAPSPSLQETASASTSPVRPGERRRPRVSEQYRRRSEGSEPNGRPSPTSSRRASLNATPPELKCRYTRCGKSAAPDTANGAAFKNCHNCLYTYCSRTCRRAHWEKHRKTCLFSRVGSLCRQVIAAAKEQEDTLLQLSVIARRGYLSQGLGAVKIFFPRPEAAEKFLGEGLGSLGEPTYVRWADLLPSEMGPQLYAELVRMCKGYNPNGKLVLYVSVCVVSEAPAAGAVKWERQLVSRCGKMRLSRTIHVPDKDSDNPETLILTSPPITEEPVLRSRAATFANIQKHLSRRGVSLKHQYPDIYKKLSSYADGTTAKFVPVTLYPKDSDTGKTFMCIIMPDVEAESVDKVQTAGVRVRTVNVLMKTEN